MTERALTAKGRQTRDRIVSAAADLMFARGVAGTSVDDVQKAAGVSASQLYHYFDGKQSLVRAVIGHQTEAVLGPQQPLLERLDSIAGLRTWRDAIVTMQRSRHCVGGCPIGSLSTELADGDPGARDDLVEGFARWEAPIRAGLQAMRDRGELRPDADPATLALAVLAALQGGLLLTQLRRETSALEAALDTVIAQIATHLA